MGLETQSGEWVAILVGVDFQASIITSHNQVILLLVGARILGLRHVLLVKLTAFYKRNWCAIHWLKRPKDASLVPHELKHTDTTIREPISNNWALSLRELCGHRNSLACSLKNVIIHKSISFVV